MMSQIVTSCIFLLLTRFLCHAFLFLLHRTSFQIVPSQSLTAVPSYLTVWPRRAKYPLRDNVRYDVLHPCPRAFRARLIMKKRRKWKLDPARPYLTALSLCNATSRSLMSFAFRHNTIVCLLEHLRNRRVCCRVFFWTLAFVSFCVYLFANLFTFFAFFISFHWLYFIVYFHHILRCISLWTSFFIFYVHAFLNLFFPFFSSIFMFCSSFTPVLPRHFHFSLGFFFLFSSTYRSFRNFIFLLFITFFYTFAFFSKSFLFFLLLITFIFFSFEKYFLYFTFSRSYNTYLFFFKFFIFLSSTVPILLALYLFVLLF